MRAKLRHDPYGQRMMARNKLGDFPTMKLREDELARAAKEADERVMQAESAAQRATKRPGPPSYPDIEVSVDVADSSLDGLTGSAMAIPPGAPLELEQEADPDHPSDVRLACRDADGLSLSSVPCVVASKEDLSWFTLEETSHVVLAMIDGESTVESIVSTLSIPRSNALAILRELGSHGVIEFHEP
jgi:hypothetical protein